MLSMAFWWQSRVKLSLFITLAMLLGVSGTVYAAAASDETFALVVRHPDGGRETVSSGEVSVRGLLGYV